MAYQNLNFPTMKLRHGFTVEVEAPTVVLGNYAKEYRINRFANEKLRFNFPGRNLTYTDWTTIYSFLDGMGWMRDSFNLVRPDTGTTVKVRLGTIPTMQVVSLTAANAPNIVSVSDIQLVQVFNE